MKLFGLQVQGDWLILHTTHEDALRTAKEFDSFTQGEYELKRIRRKRSLNANAYMWELCGKIAEASGLTKEDVYRRNIREGNEYHTMYILYDAVKDFSDDWATNGTGWFTDYVDSQRGYAMLFAYYGSSRYDSKQMSALIERVIQDAKSVGVEPMPPDKLAALLAAWDGRERKRDKGR